MLRYTSATAYGPDHDYLDVFIPSHAPQQDSAPHNLSQDNHALSTSTFFPRHTRGFVSSRIIENGYTLQLQWNSFAKGSSSTSPYPSQDDEEEEEDDQDPETNPFAELDTLSSTLPPVRFVFPARLVPSPSFVVVPSGDGSGSRAELQVYCLTETGYLYALHFAQPKLFHAPLDHGADAEGATDVEWCEEFKVGQLEGKTPVLMHGVDVSRVVVGCADGFALSVVIADGAEPLIETELRSAAFNFSVRSLIPSFSSRSLNSPSSFHPSSPSITSSPSQLISIASSPTSSSNQLSFAFAVSRDRKLKIWNLDNGHCLKSIDLPKPSLSSALVVAPSLNDNDAIDSPRGKHATGLLLSPTPQAFIKLIAGSSTSPYPSYLVLFVPAASGTPAAFFLYGITTDEDSGNLSELTPVGEKVCSGVGAGASLVDFQVAQFGLGGADWTLWTVWEEAGEGFILTASVPELEGGASKEGADEWTTVDRGTTNGSSAQWTTAHFDDLVEADPQGIPSLFITHVAYPGRYSASTLEHALKLYEDALDAERDAHGDRPVAMSLFYDSVLERIAAVVGSTVVLEKSPATGADLKDAYLQRLKIEWLRFIAMLNESRTTALFPTSLAVDGRRKVAFVNLRDGVTVPLVQETVLALADLAVLPADDARRLEFLNLSPDDLSHSYSQLAPRGFRSDVFVIVDAIKTLTSALSLPGARTLELELTQKVRSPIASSIDDLALDLYEQCLEPFVSDDLVLQLESTLTGLLSPEASFQTLWTILTSSQLVQTPTDALSTTFDGSIDGLNASTPLTASLLTSALQSSITARYTLVKGLVTLLIFISAELSSLIPQLSSFTSATFATFHSLASLHWVGEQSSVPTVDFLAPSSDNEEDALSRGFHSLRVRAVSGSDSASPPTPLPTSLLHALFLHPAYSPSILLPSLSLPTSLTSSLSAFLTSLSLVTQKRLVVDAPAEVEFGMRLRELGLPSLAREFVGFYPRGSGMLYVLGSAEMDLGRWEEARQALEKAASGLVEDNIRLDDQSGLSLVLPFEIANSLARYYRHLTSLFVERGIDIAVVRFAQLSIEAFAEETTSKNEEVEKDLWLKLFRAKANLAMWEEAYTTLMAIPDHETKLTCLAHLISVFCENDQTSLITRLAFVGLQPELERNLAFRARNSDPLAQPNYYKILYAYHVAKGDYRSAATIMFQQARRIGEMPHRSSDSFVELASLQCQSYLAATNALALVAKEHAWVAVVAANGEEDRGNKRRKMTFEIPDDEFDSTSSTRTPEIVELVDMRREYTVALARLQLAETFPELERTNFSLEPEAVVALFQQTNAFDQAFVAGRILGVDLSSLFESITERCVQLSSYPESPDDVLWITQSPEASSWEGSLASRAWRLLERHLARHDVDGTNRYRLVVLERTLRTNRGAAVPTFLLDFLGEKDPAALIRTLIKYERTEEAFRASIKCLKVNPPTASVASASLPYSLFDQLLAIDSAASGWKDELKGELAKRWEALEKADRTARRNAER